MDAKHFLLVFLGYEIKYIFSVKLNNRPSLYKRPGSSKKFLLFSEFNVVTSEKKAADNHA